MASPTALVVGAGIGGLAASLALSRRGFAVTLVERRTRLTEIGAGLQLSPNASRILTGLGLDAALRRVAVEPERVVIRRVASGREIGTMALGSFVRERFGAPYRVLLRADLQTMLLDAVRASPDVRLVVGRTCTGVAATRNAAEVTVETASGAWETLRADIAVGADGLNSTVRRAWDARSPTYQGAVAWRATLPREAVPEALRRDETGLWLGPGCHVVHYPVEGGRVLNLVAVLAGPAPSAERPVGGPPGLSALRARAAEPLAAILATEAEWTPWPLHDLPAGRMAQGRIALLGDAAHPVLPYLAQGAALAIEDAAVLADVLAGAGGQDPARALRRYARLRRRRARQVQGQARRNGAVYHAGALVAFARDSVIAALGPRRMTERYAWLYGWAPGPERVGSGP